MHPPEAVELVVAHRREGGVQLVHAPSLLAQRGRPRQGTISVTIARFPLPLRNALAELAIAGLDDEDAAAALRWLAAPSSPPAGAAAARLAAVHLIDAGGGALLAVHAPHGDAAAAHAERALRARQA